MFSANAIEAVLASRRSTPTSVTNSTSTPMATKQMSPPG